MERCLLLDLPTGPLQAVLNYLSPADHAGLREVSRSVCEHITAHIPYISLLLTDSRDLLQQWHQATRSLQHVSNIHVHVVCNITAEVFDAAMQLLSERTAVRELHLLVARDAISHSSMVGASIDTLLPLQHILPSLQTLVIQDIAMFDLLGDLKQLAAAAAATAQGWKLQSLTCRAWCYVIRRVLDNSRRQIMRFWSEFSRVTLQLPIAFPLLQHLNWAVGVLKYDLYDIDSVPLSSATVHPAIKAQQQVAERAAEEVAKCAVTTAVAHALLQLKCLEVLTISKIPDVWGVDTESSAVAAAVDALLDRGGLLHSRLPAAATAAAACTTLDDYGCWLLQHHSKLKHIRVESMIWDNCGMSWQRQQQQRPPCHSSSCEAAQVVDLDVRLWKQITKDVNAAAGLPTATAPGVTNSDVSDNRSDHSQRFAFTHRLSHFSSRPAALLMNYISRCQLVMHKHDIGVLADLLRNMKSLKHLKVEMEDHTDCSTNTQTDASTAVVTAAATVPGLQSLSLRLSGPGRDSPKVCLTSDLLLPLTTAAGGPGSNLTQLKLYGNFVSASEAAGDAAAVAAAATATAADVASSVSGPASYYALLQLDALQELVIWNWNDQNLFCLPVEFLPARLQVLEGRSLCIMMSAAADDDGGGLGDCSSNACSKHLPCTMQATHEAAVVSHLQTLTLSHCHLSSPSILASNQLQELTVSESSWLGGWAAAAAAWPSVKQLTWDCSLTNSNSGRSVAVSDCGAETIPSVESLALMKLDLLSTMWDVLYVFISLISFYLCLPQVDQLFADRCRAELRQVQQSGRTYVWHSKPGRILLVRCSSLGNMRPSRTPQQGQIMKKQQALESW